MKHLLLIPAMAAGLLAVHSSQAQKSQFRPLNVGGTFLAVNPDARSSALGSAVTGLDPDVNDIFANAAKLPFAGEWGVSLSYSPWLYDLNERKTNLAFLSAFKNIGSDQTIGVSVRYFNYGDVTFRDENGMELQQFRPREFSADLAYSRKLGTHVGLSVSMRYIRSELGSGTYNGQLQKAASAVAGDVGFYYQNTADHIEGDNRYSFGIALTNLGTKLNYTDDDKHQAFLPMNLRIGGGYTFVKTSDHTFSLVADINKMLVPTPPIYKTDANGIPTSEIAKGKDPNRSVAESIFSSFGDAPDGFREELREFTVSGGLEYGYLQKFFARIGYFFEDPDKGQRQHFAAGFGVNIEGLRADFAYLMPTGSSLQQRRSMNFTLIYTVPTRLKD